jgi:hypothetical protein
MITLSIKEYSENLYVCVHLEDTDAVLNLID